MIRRILASGIILVVIAILALDPFGHATNASSTSPWADLDCSGNVAAQDGLVVLESMAGVPTSQAQYCPGIGSPVSADSGPTISFGDINCDGIVDARDSIALLFHLGGGAAVSGGCPTIGANVELQMLGGTLFPDATWRDFGDAPDGTPTGYSTGAATGHFQTLPANGGPSHVPFGASLGEFVTTEPAPTLTGDSADDGLLSTKMQACAPSEALLLINTAGLTAQQRQQPLYLSVFADWNRDGTWSGSDSCAPEAAVVNKAVDVSGATTLDVVAVDFTGGAQVDEMWMRYVLTATPYTLGDPTTPAGETEDYLVVGGVEVPPTPAGDDVAQPQGGNKA